MRTVLKAKIHRATVTDASLHYEGSVTIDPVLMEAADILPFEQVHLLDIDNGARLTTYAIEGERGSGEICVNGAAAHLMHKGDLAIILTYTDVPEERARSHQPRLVFVDEQNRIVSTGHAVVGAPAEAAGAPATAGRPTNGSNGAHERTEKRCKVTSTSLRGMKRRGERIAMLTAYDFPSAKLVDQADADVILVGDTLGMVVLGYDTTVPVTMDDMLHHVKAVTRGVEHALVVADMPFMSYQTNADDALRNAARFMKEAGAQAVKLEGGVTVADTVRKIVDAGIPVMGHIGLTPQSVHAFGGWKVQGKTAQAAIRLMNDALALERAGAFAVVLELVPTPLAELISQRLRIPTIGIGAGAGCDGQVQVYHDLLGLYEGFVPKHAKQYAQIGEASREAMAAYVADVRSGSFPTEEQSFSMNEQALAELRTSDDAPKNGAPSGNGKRRSLHPSIPVPN